MQNFVLVGMKEFIVKKMERKEGRVREDKVNITFHNNFEERF